MGAIIFLILVAAAVGALIVGVQKTKKKNVQNEIPEEPKAVEPVVLKEESKPAKKSKGEKPKIEVVKTKKSGKAKQ